MDTSPKASGDVPSKDTGVCDCTWKSGNLLWFMDKVHPYTQTLRPDRGLRLGRRWWVMYEADHPQPEWSSERHSPSRDRPPPTPSPGLSTLPSGVPWRVPPSLPVLPSPILGRRGLWGLNGKEPPTRLLPRPSHPDTRTSSRVRADRLTPEVRFLFLDRKPLHDHLSFVRSKEQEDLLPLTWEIMAEMDLVPSGLRQLLVGEP